MRTLNARVSWMLVIAAWLVCLSGCATTPPMAKKVPTTVNLGGQPVVDDYWWLRNKADPAVIAYLKSENAYTDAAMKSTLKLQDTLYNEMLARIQETDESVPHQDGDWWYSTKTEKGKQYAIYLRRHGSPTAPPEVVTDVNQLAIGHPFFDYNPGTVSDDGNLLAYSTDVTGNRQFVLQVKDLRNGKVLPDTVDNVDSYAWAADNQTIYYVKEEAESKRAYRLYRHTLGKDVHADDLVYEEKDEEFSIDVGRTRDRKYLVVESDSKTESESRVIPADHAAEPVLIEPRKADLQYYVDHRNGRFYLRVNDTSRNFRIVTAPESSPGSKSWSELVPARAEVIIGDLDVFAHDLVVTERRDGLPQLAVAPLPDGAGDPAAGGKILPKEIKFDESDFTVAAADNDVFDSRVLRFRYTSLTTPSSVFDYDMATGKRTLLKRQPVGGGFNPANYREERLFATAKDGTKIPISLVYRLAAASSAAGSSEPGPTRPPGPQPMLLEAYGSYGDPDDVYFSSLRVSLLDRGMTYAVAHVRGGGEYGRAWYDAGRMKNKPNTFGDFIACAEFLEKEGYTSPSQLAIEGASAGGLLIGAVLNEKPELFHAAIADVPWVDVLADMSDASIPLTTLEYTEWGNPNVPAERAVIAAYDPYSNVRPEAYPDLLVRESLNDSQVQYWDAARWVARLRDAKKHAGEAGKSELLFKMNMDAGHGGASGRYSEIHDEAFDDAWLLTRLGVEK